MNETTIIISILTVLCVAGALGAIIFAITASSRADAAAHRRNEKRAKPPKAAEPVQMSEPEPANAPAPAPALVPAVPEEETEDVCISNIPHTRNPRFYGCEKLMSKIRSNFASQSHVSLVDGAQGFGGVGKTSVAVEYALRYMNDYKLIWWIRASDSALISADFASLAAKLDLRFEDAGPDVVREAVCHALGRCDGWLLIFDDAVNPELVRSYIPSGENGHVIITSRVSDWWQCTVPISMLGFERAESAEMLLARCKSTNGVIASQLAHLMNDLPLALDQAIVHAYRSRMSLGDYLTTFRARKKLIAPEIGETIDSDDVISITLSIALDQVRKESDAAVDLLNLLAFLSSEGLPAPTLKKALQETSEFKLSLSDESIFDQALKTLHQNALVSLGNNMIYTHGLVRAAVRSALEGDKKAAWAEKALNLAANMFSFDSKERESRSRCSLVFTHALAAVDYADDLGVKSDVMSSLLDDVSIYMRACEELKRSVDLAYRALSIAEVTFGSTHPRIAVCADTLGASLHKLGDLIGARNQYERALKIDETAYGPNHPSVAVRLGNMGDILRELGIPEQASAYLERALEIAEATYGSDHANVAARSTSLALALQAKGDLKEAKKLFQRALEIDETIYGLTHPGVADRVHCLGLVYTELGDPDQAQMCFERALRIEKSTYGYNHPRVAARVTYLGLFFESIGDLEGVRDCYEEALAIDEAVYGSMHPNLVSRIDALGCILEKMGNYQAAKDYYLQALVIEEMAYGSDDIKVAKRALKLGKTYTAAGDLFSARQQLERAIEIHQSVYGATAVDLVDDLMALSDVFRDLGDSKNARIQLGRALLISQEQHGMFHPNTEGIRRSLATFAY
ncbi:MAG: tetratricopeptide repeat protein [Armatimonadetes bacterium]|nr:tetratricopeptide repeat protein [Armatimonadota bacterium]